MHTAHTHQAAADYDTERRTFRIHGLAAPEYLRRLAHIAAQWPTPAERTRTVDLRRPVAPPPLPAPAWAPLLVSAVQAALSRPVIVRGMP